MSHLLAKQVLELSSLPKQSHKSKLDLGPEKEPAAPPKARRFGRSKRDENHDQNTFPFMEAHNQRGIFDDLPKRNLYEGEDLDVPSYLQKRRKNSDLSPKSIFSAFFSINYEGLTY